MFHVAPLIQCFSLVEVTRALWVFTNPKCHNVAVKSYRGILLTFLYRAHCWKKCSKVLYKMNKNVGNQLQISYLCKSMNVLEHSLQAVLKEFNSGCICFCENHCAQSV